jgi:hypothetical protein
VFKAELHLRSGERCLRAEVCTAKLSVLTLFGYLHQSPLEEEHECRRRPYRLNCCIVARAGNPSSSQEHDVRELSAHRRP